MIVKPELTVSNLLFRCTACSRVLIEKDKDVLGCCSFCGGKQIRIAFQVSDRELKMAIDRGFPYDESNFTYVPQRMIDENKLPGRHELFRDVEPPHG